jgi:hypothetical protein
VANIQVTHDTDVNTARSELFDRFGDFEGFIPETDEEERRYLSRERDIEILTERAWRERLRVTVLAERDDPRTAASIVIWEPPTHL